MKKNLRSASGLMAGVVMGTLAVAQVASTGCVAAPSEKPLDGESASQGPLASFEAGPRTTTETGVARWVVYQEGQGFHLAGVDSGGAILHHIHIHAFAASVTDKTGARDEQGYELTSSNGGVALVTLDGRILEYLDDPGVFSGFAQDANTALKAQDGKIPYSCDFWQWITCGGAILSAIAECGPMPGSECLYSVIAAAGSCGDCVAQALDNGGGSGSQTGLSCYTVYGVQVCS